MHSKAVQERIKKALEFRKELKEEYPNIKAFVAYPATLMVCHDGQQKYKVEKIF